MQGGAPQVKIDLHTHLTMDIPSRSSSEQTYLHALHVAQYGAGHTEPQAKAQDASSIEIGFLVPTVSMIDPIWGILWGYPENLK